MLFPFMGNNNNIKWLPFINIIGYGSNAAVYVIEILECYYHMFSGGKIYATCIANKLLPHLIQHDTLNTLTYLVFFDGASNLQNDSKILEVKYTWISVFNGVGHCI